MVKIPFKEGDNIMGKKDANVKPALQLQGAGIAKIQGIINYNSEDRVATLVPNSDDFKKYRIMVNGNLVSEAVEIQHGDRILVGNHHYF